MSKKNRNRNGIQQPDRYQHEALFEASRRRHLEFPSATAREVADTLRVLGVAVEPQRRLGTSLYALDFYLPEFRAGVLINDRRASEYRRRDTLARRRALCRDLGIESIEIEPGTEWARQIVEVVTANCTAAKAA